MIISPGPPAPAMLAPLPPSPVPPSPVPLAPVPSASRWPLFAGLGPLGALPTAPGLARAFSSLVLGGWGLVALADDALLVVSELAANVTQAAAGPDGRPCYGPSGRLPVLWLRLLSDGARLRVEVWDTLPAGLGVPAPRDATTDDESGRGLRLVAGLSQDWGWEHLPATTLPARAAKRVWALLAPAKDDVAPGGVVRAAVSRAGRAGHDGRARVLPG